MIGARAFKRCALAAVAAPALLLADAAHGNGARLVLLPAEHATYICRATVLTRDGQPVPTLSSWKWGSHVAAVFELGELPVGIDGDSPIFGALSVSCWLPDALWPGDPPRAPDGDEPTYSLTLARYDPAWYALDPISHQTALELPRDGRVLFFTLERTAIEQRPIRIVRATLGADLFGSLGYEVYGPWMHRYFVPDPAGS